VIVHVSVLLIFFLRYVVVAQVQTAGTKREIYYIVYIMHYVLCIIYYIYGVVCVATCHGLDSPEIESRWRKVFPFRLDGPWGPPTLLYNGYRIFLGDKVAGA
jgi:uncharacterized membrane protein YozB (DUF420 family)